MNSHKNKKKDFKNMNSHKNKKDFKKMNLHKNIRTQEQEIKR